MRNVKAHTHTPYYIHTPPSREWCQSTSYSLGGLSECVVLATITRRGGVTVVHTVGSACFFVWLAWRLCRVWRVPAFHQAHDMSQ